MVIAVEPGVYVPGRFGARVENVFIVTPEGGVELRDAMGVATWLTSTSASTTPGCTVSDLDRSLAFYRDLLGFEVVLEQEKQGGYLGAIVGYPDAHVRMALREAPADRPPPRAVPVRRPRDRRRRGTRAVHDRADARLPDRRRSPPRSTNACAPPASTRSSARRSRSTRARTPAGSALYLRDPDGIILELFQPPK